MPSLEDLVVLARVLEADVEKLVYLAVPTESDARRELKQAQAAGGKEGERQAVRLRQLLAARREARRRKALELLRPIPALRRVPFAGDVAAGPPKLAIEQPGEYTDVLDAAVDYALVVRGDSMVGAGIEDGDTVWVRRDEAAKHGDTVVALIDGEEITVKHLVEENGHWLLRANNPYKDYPDIPLGPRDEIIGVVKWVVKTPGPPPVRAVK